MSSIKCSFCSRTFSTRSAYTRHADTYQQLISSSEESSFMSKISEISLISEISNISLDNEQLVPIFEEVAEEVKMFQLNELINYNFNNK